MMRLYLHFSWLNSVRQTEQRKGDSEQFGLRQTTLISSSLCFSVMQVSFDFMLNFESLFFLFIIMNSYMVILKSIVTKNREKSG